MLDDVTTLVKVFVDGNRSAGDYGGWGFTMEEMLGSGGHRGNVETKYVTESQAESLRSGEMSIDEM